MTKICYFKASANGAGSKVVRFGTSQRPEAQVTTQESMWARIVEMFVADGYRIVEVRDNGMGGAE